MQLRFSIEYLTAWGQELRVVGSGPELGAGEPGRAPRMTCVAGGLWVLDVELSRRAIATLRYRYCVVHPTGRVEWEGGAARTVPAALGAMTRVDVSDEWRPAVSPARALASAVFTRAIHGGRRVVPCPAPPVPPVAGPRCRFAVEAVRVDPGCIIGVLGSIPSLGSWREGAVVPLDDGGYPVWRMEVPLGDVSGPVEYKYVIYDPAAGRVRHWESGRNRTVPLDPRRRGNRLLLRNDGTFRHPSGPWRGAGVAVPVFALRSARGLGVGEFADIKRLVDWACVTGLKLIEFLPVQDTVATGTCADANPYQAVSAFALHPLYLALDEMQVLDDATTQAWLAPHREQLNALADVDYAAVMAVKSEYCRRAYAEVREAFLANPRFRAFFAEHRDWLVPYAAFACLRDRYGTSDYSRWPGSAGITPEALDAFTAPDAPHFDQVAIHYFIQYHLHRQLLDAAAYARTHGVALKFTIPAGLPAASADAWIAPAQFDRGVRIGLPPETGNADGQDWEFCAYNWDVMAGDGYAWWRRRLAHVARYADAVRLDHVVGFARTWEIPREQVTGSMGHYRGADTLTPGDLQRWGLGFDRERFSRPYIRRHMLEALFGAHADRVAREFLEEGAPGCFRPKPEFATQRQVLEFLERSGTADAVVRDGLLRLLAEVLVLDDPRAPGERFYPRHSLQQTYAFAELDAGARDPFNRLHGDYFHARHEGAWCDQALARLTALCDATPLLVCADDLGQAPAGMPGVLAELGIAGLCIQRLPRAAGQEFSHPSGAPYLAVASPATPDRAPLRSWWEEDFARTQRFYSTVLGQVGATPVYCEPWICRDVLAQHLESPAMWAIFQLSDLLAIDGRLRRDKPAEERISSPGAPRRSWRYRMHLGLDELVEAHDFNAALRRLIADGGRAPDA